jgi:alanine racemase
MSSIQEIKDWSKGDWLAHGSADAVIEELAIDTRNIDQPENALFIAVKTPLRDGHQFITGAWQKGVRNFLVSTVIDISTVPGANVILVPDTVEALQNIAAAYRSKFSIPVIGITGSNGKTIVKEWLSELLGHTFNLVRSPKSYNSQLGVPLSVWLLQPEHELAVFEAGISLPGEMARLEPVIRPTIGIFTNIGEAHNEGFSNTEQKINEKLQLFARAGRLICCTDNVLLANAVGKFEATHPAVELFTWSRTREATLFITEAKVTATQTTITATYCHETITISIPFTDEASVENAIHCWCVMLMLGMTSSQTKERMAALQQVSMRLELRQGINDCTIINDTYNSDLTSLQMALNYLAQQKQHDVRTVIMSDILQPGKRNAELYEDVALQISRRGINRFIGIGPALYENRTIFKKHKKISCVFFKNTEHFLKNFHRVAFEKETILLKGARIFAFEKIALLLEQKVHQTVMSIDLSALRQNLDVFRARLDPGVKTMAMVKAFAYGSGSYEIANYLQYAGIDYLAVAYTDEGIALRKAGIKTPIMVMSPDATSFDRMIAWKLEPELYNFRSFDAFVAIAQTLNVTAYPVHIKLDTGMHRLGFEKPDIDALIRKIATSSEIRIASVFSHLAASDDEGEDHFTQHQATLFENMSASIIAALPYTPLRHLCNSAGISRHRPLQYDMVRLGLGLYGVDGSGELQNKLRQISTLKTSIAQVREIPTGDNIGYGHHTIATRDMRLATICIGYADGYPRTMGHGKAHVLIHGQKAPTVGIICMDMCMVDITDIPDVAEGDEATIFSNELPVTKLAAWAGTISYEIMTGISQRVKRVYTNNE